MKRTTRPAATEATPARAPRTIKKATTPKATPARKASRSRKDAETTIELQVVEADAPEAGHASHDIEQYDTPSGNDNDDHGDHLS